jgi:hypothetical protein
MTLSSRLARPKDAQGRPDFTADGIIRDNKVNRLAIAWFGTARGTGVGGTILFEDVFPLSGTWGRQVTSAGADVALVHEMIHALRHLRGAADRTPIFLPNSTTQADGTWLNVDEREVIDAPSPALSENGYRAEVGVARRRCVAPTCF